MGTQQVPIWIPIVVGIIGVIGIISGQLVNAWREDRRWRREVEREELRWQREQRKEADSRAEANRAHWRDKKFEVYTDLYSFTRRWSDLIDDAARSIDTDKVLPDKLKSDLNQACDDCFEHVDQIYLLTTDDDARHGLDGALDTFYTFAGMLLDGQLPAKRLDKVLSGTTEALNYIVSGIRIDLGIANRADRKRLSE